MANMESEEAKLQHEEDETYILRTIYQQALREVRPDLDESTILTLSLMVVKKARYGVIYEEAVETLIGDLNQEIKDYYGS